MGEMQAKNWRREQRVIDHGPELLVPEERYEENRQRRMQEEQILQSMTYRSDGAYTRNARRQAIGKVVYVVLAYKKEKSMLLVV